MLSSGEEAPGDLRGMKYLFQRGPYNNRIKTFISLDPFGWGNDLTIGGMTCASCAHRVERKLNKLDGVVATVNLATEKAHVTYPAELDPAALVAEVEAAGYTATLPTPDPPPATDPTRSLRTRGSTGCSRRPRR